MSVGYRVYEYNEKTGKDGALPIRTAVDWEPFEISVVPMGADPGAQLRSDDSVEKNECVITRSGGTMDPEDDVIVEPAGKQAAPAPESRSDPKPDPTDHEKGVVEAERDPHFRNLSRCRVRRDAVRVHPEMDR